MRSNFQQRYSDALTPALSQREREIVARQEPCPSVFPIPHHDNVQRACCRLTCNVQQVWVPLEAGFLLHIPRQCAARVLQIRDEERGLRGEGAALQSQI